MRVHSHHSVTCPQATVGEMSPRRVPFRVISRLVTECFGVNCKADINVWV